MATPRSQRIGIWIIAIVMVIGTLGSFAVLILAPSNEANDQANVQAVAEKYQAEYEVYQEKVDAQAAQLSKEYYDQFKKYADRPAPFDAKGTTEVKTNDLKIGSGAEIKESTPYSAYYIGWNPKGKVFDQSINGQSLKAPIEGGNLIPGWNEGVIGMKVGGVREITIPSDKAYGETGSGEDIPPNTPLKFIVMIIEKPESIPQPEVPEELLQQNGNQ